MSDEEPQAIGVATLAPGTLVGGKFRVVRLLGAGGMGAVYEIEHEITKHRRALKLLHAEVQRYPGLVARFLREASAAGRVGNAHIIETFDAGTLTSGEPYLVMEMLAGETVADLLARKTRLGMTEMIDLIGQACDGVQAAHEAGIVHRDLKPENLFVTSREGRPFVKILDFGVSKFDPATTGSMALTSEGSAIGTPFYMPPEQVRGGKDIDARADVYALGVILYECATGGRPFEAETLPHLALLIHEGKYEPLATRRPDLPALFGEIVSCAMAGDRGARFPTARALADALRMVAAPPVGVAGAMLGATTPAVEAPIPSFRPVTTAPAASASVTAPPGGGVTSAAVTFGVTAGVAGQRTPPDAPRGKGAAFALTAGVLVVTGVAALVLFRKAPSKDDVRPAVATSAAPSATNDDPAVTPVTSVSPPASAPPPAASVVVAQPPPGKARPSGPIAPPPTAPPTTPTTRADQKGLAKDNPFK